MAAADFEGCLARAGAAERSNVKRDRLRRAPLEGRLPARKIGAGARMPLPVGSDDVEKLLAETPKGPEPRARDQAPAHAPAEGSRTDG